MAITITDPKLIAEIEAARDCVEFHDATGRVLNSMVVRKPIPPEVLANVKLLTKEDVERIRNQPGQTLEDILAEFRAEGICT